MDDIGSQPSSVDYLRHCLQVLNISFFHTDQHHLKGLFNLTIIMIHNLGQDLGQTWDRLNISFISNSFNLGHIDQEVGMTRNVNQKYSFPLYEIIASPIQLRRIPLKQIWV